MSNIKCKNCGWFKPMDSYEETSRGYCVLFPPTVIYSTRNEREVFFRFPEVPADSYCGQFKRRRKR